MVNHTTRGFPSIANADKLGDIDVVMLELATFLEARVKLLESGTFSHALTTVGTVYTQAVTFANPFTSAPRVILVPLSVTPDLVHVALNAAPTTTGFVAAVKRATGQSVPVVFHWFAHG